MVRFHATRDATQFRDAWAPHTQTQALVLRDEYSRCSVGEEYCTTPLTASLAKRQRINIRPSHTPRQ